MSLWQQVYPTQLLFTDTLRENYLQQYNFEILNFTSLNFARPRTPTDSHTAAMTAERRKLFEQLPRINTNVNNKKCSPQEPPKKFTTMELTESLENYLDVTQNDSHAHDVTALPDHDDEEDKKKRNKLKVLRRASAPAQGIEYYFKNAKSKKDNALNYFERRQHNVPSVHVEVDESVENNDNQIQHHHHHHHHHNHHNNANSATSIVSPSDHPPSLSPCSSTSSLSSAVDMLSPETTNNQPFISQDYNYWSIKSKSKTIASEHYKTESHSYPDNVCGSLYDNVPWSPAASFLSSLANSTVRKALPDDEGQQVGEFIIGKIIGTGGFSIVKQAHTMDSYSGSMETAAVKIVKNHPGSDDNDRVQALLEREIAIWRRLDHPNIVQMLSAEENDYATFVFSEYCPGGTLLDYIKKHRQHEGKGLDEDEARNIFLEIAEALRYLHNDMRLVHKDIKLDNILLDKEDTWKICDFGLTEFQNSANGYNNILYNNVGGSLAYCAPEQLRSPTPLKDPSVDVWSLGVVLFAMVTGQLPFCDDFEPRLQFKIINGRYDESLLDDAGVSEDLKDLLKGMFKAKPDQRLTISQVLEHRWCER
ncbi:hypothetical protein RclHR1_07320010 [Rhizophagus clarus]|uniref:Kinase-like protein n=1 Tax=Rhizophagus clarus TaxID=94130 RepID=A0A2Z6SKR7_9GLOM|nr:hypothetical protein RclHR1_07320010 [Rhizophagus clarus]GES81891.1 kinase-like protein [Rhizophagus clarus]